MHISNEVIFTGKTHLAVVATLDHVLRDANRTKSWKSRHISSAPNFTQFKELEELGIVLSARTTHSTQLPHARERAPRDAQSMYGIQLHAMTAGD